jgi:cellulose biosynthesis protein BcsQ
MCCLNALVASDYLLIPVMPSKQATSRVPSLVRTIAGIDQSLKHNLQVMGIVANRTRSNNLTNFETNLLSNLREQARDILGYGVPVFQNLIPQGTDIRDAEVANRMLDDSDSLFSSFLAVAQEVVQNLPTFCQPRGELVQKEGLVT